ncbi:unnamed protein product [Chrysoparadoxa australica]
MAYEQPDWGGEPGSSMVGQIALEVIRGGCVLEKLDISKEGKPYYVVGRLQGSVDILMEHPSISRKHAVLQHETAGRLHLWDNGSTHGTCVNKVKLPPKTYRQLAVGDVIKFGASTRLFVVCGPDDMMPPEYNSANLEKLRALSEAKREKRAEVTKRQEADRTDVSWGFDEDAQEEDEEEDSDDEELPDYLKNSVNKQKRSDTKIGVKEEDVNEKDRKAFEKLQAKALKIEHMHLEMEKIRAKDSAQGGLTQGQQNQISRNEERIKQLREQMGDIEATIREKNKQRLETISKRKTEAQEVEEAEDDFYDRTKSSAKTKASVKERRFGKKRAREGKADRGAVAALLQEVEDGAADFDALVKNRDEIAAKLERVKAGLLNIELSGSDGGDGEADALDAFMAKNEEQNLAQRKEVLLAQEAELKNQLMRCEALVKIAQPALPQLKAVKQMREQERKEAASTSPAEPVAPNTKMGPPAAAPPGPLAPPTMEPPSSATAPQKSKSQSMGPPGQAMAPPGRIKPKAIPPVPKFGTPVEGGKAQTATAPTSTPALAPKAQSVTELSGVAAQVKPAEADPPKKRARVARGPQMMPPPKGSAVPAPDEVQEVDWVAPKNQKGDGRTALNEKFGY